MRLLVAMIFLASGPATAQLVKSPRYIKVVEAIESAWAPGAVQKNAEPSGGMIYEVRLRITKGGTKNFSGLLVNGVLLPVEVIKDQQRNFSGPLKKGDVVTLMARTEKGKPSAPSDPVVITFLNEGNNSQTSWVLFEAKRKMRCTAIPRFGESGSKKLNE